MQGERQLEALGVFVHGMLAGLHLLGVVHNVRKRNWIDVAAHASAAAYDIWAANEHMQDCRSLDQGGAQ